MPSQLVDGFGRRINYVRLSVTDRCDFRCVYCMTEKMEFLPHSEVLSLEEIYDVAAAFTQLGTNRIRLTGGEPLVRRNILSLIERLGRLPAELCLTTNGSQLPKMAQDLAKSGVDRLNISLDSINPERFRELTRTDRLQQVLDGIEAARSAGFKRIKLNAVVLKGRNDDEVLDLVEFARRSELDISFIEEMPLGHITEHGRAESFCSSDELRELISSRYEINPSTERTGGPSKYYRLAGSDTRVGFISPHSHNFCGDCNRVRVTVEGRLLLCLGNEHSVDLRDVMRTHPGDQARLQQAIIDSMAIKPEKHEFNLEEAPQILRFMNMTGG